MLMGARAHDETVWRQESLALENAGRLAAAASVARNVAALSEASDAVYLVCEKCHERYLPKP